MARWTADGAVALSCAFAAACLILRAKRRAQVRGERSCTIRLATVSDVEGIARCWAEAYPDQGPDYHELDSDFLAERTLEQFRPRTLERVSRGDTLVATDPSGAVVGFSVLDTNEVEQFFVSARARGTGVAAQLMERAEGLLWARGTELAHLFCFVQNQRAIRFYERCGWACQGVCAHDVQISGGRTSTLRLMRLEKSAQV